MHPEKTAPGVKIVALVTKRPDISFEEFVELWTDAHVRLSSKLGMTSYRINVARSTFGGEDPLIDGTAEMTWPSLEQFRAAMESDDGRVAAADAERFAARIQLLIVDEWIVV